PNLNLPPRPRPSAGGGALQRFQKLALLFWSKLEGLSGVLVATVSQGLWPLPIVAAQSLRYPSFRASQSRGHLFAALVLRRESDGLEAIASQGIGLLVASSLEFVQG